ncbi:MAG: hypothetical protein H5T63_08880 [Chloroflexi bacterium]|nr:hypothetical protein [Chloroflexota bacterium]
MLTASGAVKASPGLLIAVVLTHSDAAQITVKDGGATGTAMLGLRLPAAGSVVFSPAMPVSFTSLYVTVDTGTAPEISIVYV